MAKVLVIAEHRDGKLKKTTFELISAFSAGGNEVHCLLAGHGVDAFSTDLASYGAKKIHLAQDAALKFYNAESYLKVTLKVVELEKPDYIVAAHTPTGRDFLPHLSARLGCGLASDCTSVKFSGGSLQVRRPVYAGKATAEVEFLGSGPKCLTIRPNSFGAPKAQAGAALNVANVPVDLGGLKSTTLDVVKGSVERPDVTEASIVVSGGRAMKNAENFKILESLADILGAAVGASRAAVDSGFRPHRDQVGQTGKVVSPSLYIAFGISGAIQHLAGMRTSKTIVAVNSDPEAPIFQLADYGVVGDLFQLVPLLTQEFKRLKESQ